MLDLLYFAYGSNMKQKRLAERIARHGPFENVGTLVVKGYKLAFTGGFYNSGVANMEPAKGHSIEGVLYRITDKQIYALDGYEGYPQAYVKRYGYAEKYRALFYWYYAPDNGFKKRDLSKPNLDYLNYMIDGALENKLKTTYDELFQYKLKNYALKKAPSYKFK